MDFDFKVPSTVPQDLLLIQDLIGALPPAAVADERVLDSLDSSDDSIASTNSEVESEDEVEAGLAPRDDDSAMSEASSDSASPSDSELDSSSSSDSEDGRERVVSQWQRSRDDVDDEEAGITATYLQTKNEIFDANILVPSIFEVEPSDVLEKVGEVMSIVGNIVIVRGLPVDHVSPPSERTLDAESLLVFEDRKVLGYIYETFGPTSQPFYQVKFNQHYPLDIDTVRVSREVFHVPQRSRFVFVDQLKNLRGSDASNIHDEEPAEDEVEFSDDEKEAAFRAQRKKRRGGSVSSSRQPTPPPPRIDVDDMFQSAHCGANPYDAHGPYDDDYHVTGPPRPPPVPYDDPYSDAPTSEIRSRLVEMGGEFGGEPSCERREDVFRASRGSARGRGRSHQPWRTSRRGHRHNPIAFRRTLDSPAVSQMVECANGQIGDAITSQTLIQPILNPWLSPEIRNTQGCHQPFIQPHINPRFASAFGLNLPSPPIIPWASQNILHDHAFPPPWVDPWTIHGSAGSEGEGDTYRPM